MTLEPILEVCHLSKSFGTHQVLRDVNFTVHPGDVTSILGSSGSGKSTLLRCINLLERPNQGEVRFHGRPITGRGTDASAYRTRVGMVFQSFNLFSNMNVLENCMAGPVKVLRRSREEARARALRYLEQVGMAPYINARPRQLSGGQKQRVAIAGVMAMKPQCIVLDEPTAMLDPNGRAEVIRTVRELNRKEGITAVLITHYMEEVIDADRVIVMDDGAIVMDGTPREVFSQVEKLKEYRLDVPQATELAYELKKAGVDLPDGILSQEEFVEAFLACCPGELLTERQTGNADGDSCGSHSSCRDTESREEQTEAAGR